MVANGMLTASHLTWITLGPVLVIILLAFGFLLIREAIYNMRWERRMAERSKHTAKASQPGRRREHKSSQSWYGHNILVIGIMLASLVLGLQSSVAGVVEAQQPPRWEAFRHLFGDSPAPHPFDLNGDGKITIADWLLMQLNRQQLAVGGGRCPDITGGGVVDLFDLATVALYFGQEVDSRDSRKADLNHDGIIDDDDVEVLRQHWGEICRH